ncbi:unnamed protein product [Symbiodinium microadriaticum]|nr:unnamed protein product [Symbiodinium microadriaticum]
MTLRSVLHKLEADGHVDVTLGGHTFVRPPSVANGQQKDFFHITKTSELCWRPNGMQIKSAKMNNIMSMYVVLVIDNALDEGDVELDNGPSTRHTPLQSNEILDYGVHHRWFPKVKELLAKRQGAGQGTTAVRFFEAGGWRIQFGGWGGTSGDVAGSTKKGMAPAAHGGCKVPTVLCLRGNPCSRCILLRHKQGFIATGTSWCGAALR